MRCGAAVSVAMRHYGQGVSEQGDLSLQLLKAIDATVNWLGDIHNAAASAADMGEGLLKTLQGCARERPIDDDGELRELYLKVEHKTKAVVDVLTSKLELAKSDRRLHDHHLDSLISEFNRAIEAVAALHDMLIALRWAIAEHDADLEAPVGAPCSSADEFFKSVKI